MTTLGEKKIAGTSLEQRTQDAIERYGVGNENARTRFDQVAIQSLVGADGDDDDVDLQD